MSLSQSQLARYAAQFSTYAQREYRGASPLYEKLALAIRDDEFLLEIAAHGRSQIPNLFLGAVHYLLARYPADPLAAYFASFCEVRKADENLSARFRSFCFDHREELIEIVSTRLVQTNEVGRCGYLYPAFLFVSKLVKGRPLALIDIGTSAGLHLCCDKYVYDYGAGRFYGDADSRVKISVELRGSRVPDLTTTSLAVAVRIGIDLNPISSDREEDVRWLEALIWPEHRDRREMLRQALEIARRERSKITTTSGDAVELIGDVIGSVPDEIVPCVFQTHIWRELSSAAKSGLIDALEEAGRKRSLFFISALGQLTLRSFGPRGGANWTLANYESHGRWLEWLAGQQGE